MATLSQSGVVDADGHVFEPPTLWDDYLEAEFRDRSINVVGDGITHVTLARTRTCPFWLCHRPQRCHPRAAAAPALYGRARVTKPRADEGEALHLR